MRIAGVDYSTHAVDCVFIDDDTGRAEWRHWPLTGNDSFDRTRAVRDAMPSRGWWEDEGVLAIGIEHPGGHHGTRDMIRVQGAILACLPTSLLVCPWPPAKWRKAVGLPGNASKLAVAAWADRHLARSQVSWGTWPQDACDAYCIAQATISALIQDEKEAA